MMYEMMEQGRIPPATQPTDQYFGQLVVYINVHMRGQTTQTRDRKKGKSKTN